jgi:hypothetical protein
MQCVKLIASDFVLPKLDSLNRLYYDGSTALARVAICSRSIPLPYADTLPPIVFPSAAYTTAAESNAKFIEKEVMRSTTAGSRL